MSDIVHSKFDVPTNPSFERLTMRTDFPTIDLYFVLGHTFCKLTIYEMNEAFARKVLEANRVREWLEEGESREGWQEIDTRILLTLVSDGLPKLLVNALPSPTDMVVKAAAEIGFAAPSKTK